MISNLTIALDFILTNNQIYIIILIKPITYRPMPSFPKLLSLADQTKGVLCFISMTLVGNTYPGKSEI